MWSIITLNRFFCQFRYFWGEFWKRKHFGHFWRKKWRKRQSQESKLEIVPNGVMYFKGTASPYVTRGGYYIYTWRARRQIGVLHVTASRFTRSRPSRIIPKRDSPEDSYGDGVMKLDWTTRNSSRGEMTASAIKRGRRHLCKSIYSFQFFIH